MNPHLQGRVLGLRAITLSPVTGFVPVTAAVLQGAASPVLRAPPISGVARISWWISSVIAPGAAHVGGAVPPRVKIGWTAHDEAANGNLLNPPNANDPASRSEPPFLLADAWYGQVELIGTSFSIQAGYLAEDGTPDATYVLMATIAQGGTGAAQHATFSRIVSFAAPPGSAKVYIPGATPAGGGLNNGASRCPWFSWLGTAAAVVTITPEDFGGNATGVISTGALVAPGLGEVQRFPLSPDTLRLDVAAVAGATGRVLFSYF